MRLVIARSDSDEAIQLAAQESWIASSLSLLAMTIVVTAGGSITIRRVTMFAQFKPGNLVTKDPARFVVVGGE